MSLPSFPNSMVGTRLLDILSTKATSNEVVTFGYSNSSGVKIRMYDKNTPANGLVLGYNTSSNYTFGFTRDNGTISLGINTTLPSTTTYILGDSIVTGTFTTSNITVSGISSISGGINFNNNKNINLYQPTGTDGTATLYKNIVTNDSTYTNRILFSTSLNVDKYLINITLPYKNIATGFTTSGSNIKISLYQSTPVTFNPNILTPIQSQSIYLEDVIDQYSDLVQFYLNVPSVNNYIIAVSGNGETIQFGGNNRICSTNITTTASIGTDHSYTVRKPLSSTAIRQTFIPTINTNTFVITTPQIYKVTDPQNVEVYSNGLKLAYYSPTYYDYSVSYTNIGLTTNFTITTKNNVLPNTPIDIIIWPETISSNIYEPLYVYQNITNNSVDSTNKITIDSTSGYVGIGTTIIPQRLTVNGIAYFSDNVGIGTTNPSALLNVYDTFNDGTTPMAIQHNVVGQEFPPVGVSNFYFIPDYKDTILSIDIANQLSNLEYPPSAFTSTNSNTTYLLNTYGAGAYTVSASSYQANGYEPWLAFNKINAGTGPTNSWSSSPNQYNTTSPYGYAYVGLSNTYDINGTSYPGEWLQIQLPIPIKLEKYSINVRPDSTTTNPSQWNVLDSSDGINWNLLDKRNGITWTAGATNQYGITNPTRYSSYYRLITSNLQGNGGYVSIGEWRLFTNTVIGQNYYPKFKATITYYNSDIPYGLGQYQIWTNTIQDFTYSNQTLPSGLFNKSVGSTSNSVWTSYFSTYNRNVDASPPPTIYAQFPDLLQLTSYSLTARGGNALETPSKWILYGSNTSQTMNWQALNTQYGITTWTAFETKTYTVTTSSAYNFYKLELLRNSSTTATLMSLGELKFYGSKQTPEPRMVVSTNGFIGIGTTIPQTVLDINGDLSVSGNLGEDILRVGPYVNFDGSTTNRDLFFKWMQYVTSTEYRFKFKRPELNTTWWNTNNTITNYINYNFVSMYSDRGNCIDNGIILPSGKIIGGTSDPSICTMFNNILFVEQYLSTNNNYKYYGGILLPNGNVIFTPNTTQFIQIVTTKNLTLGTRFVDTNMSYPSGQLYRGGVLLPNGNVLFIPYYTNIGLYNPNTDIFSTIIIDTSSISYSGGVLLPDGRVIFVPYETSLIGIYDSTNNTFSKTISTGLSGMVQEFYDGGVLLPDGRVLFIPSSYSYIGIFNSLTNTFTTINIVVNNGTVNAYSGGVLLPDGRVVLVPKNLSYVGIFNPYNNSYSSISTGGISQSDNIGGLLLPNGTVLFRNSGLGNSIFGIRPSEVTRPPPIELCLHPCFNKF